MTAGVVRGSYNGRGVEIVQEFSHVWRPVDKHLQQHNILDLQCRNAPV